MEKVYSGLKKYKKELILGPLFKVIEVIFELITPFIMSYIVSEGIELVQKGDSITRVLYPGLLMIAFTIFGFLSTCVCQYIASVASQGFGTDLRNRIFKKVESLSFLDIEKFDRSYLINLVNNDAGRVQQSVAMMIRLVIRAPILLIGALICSFIINVKVGFIFLAIVPILVLFITLIFYLNNKQYVKVQKRSDDIVTFSTDSLNGIRYIRAFNEQDEHSKEHNKYSNLYYEESKKANIIAALVNPITFFIINVAIMLVAIFGGNMIVVGDLDRGDVVALISYLSQIFTAVIVVTNLVVTFNKAFASKKRIDSLLTYQSNFDTSGTRSNISINKGEPILEFKDVSFSYLDNDVNVIKNLNFTINKGETIGIIGGTGSGKTTIIKLIERFFDATQGMVIYKNEDIKKYSLNALREEISLIGQNNVLFKGTIKSNILLGKKDATDEEVIRALKSSEALEFVNKYSDTIDHEVVEGGRNFSGGQKQRICIARGLIKDSEILILDDSTSALDYLTEKKVRDNIKNKRDDLTFITISQRISSIINCDKIFVVDNGEIIASGKHDELLNSCALYKDIYATQSEDKGV